MFINHPATCIVSLKGRDELIGLLLMKALNVFIAILSVLLIIGRLLVCLILVFLHRTKRLVALGWSKLTINKTYDKNRNTY